MFVLNNNLIINTYKYVTLFIIIPNFIATYTTLAYLPLRFLYFNLVNLLQTSLIFDEFNSNLNVFLILSGINNVLFSFQSIDDVFKYNEASLINIVAFFNVKFSSINELISNLKLKLVLIQSEFNENGSNDYFKSNWNRLRVASLLKVYFLLKTNIFLLTSDFQKDSLSIIYDLLIFHTSTMIGIFSVSSIISLLFEYYAFVIRSILLNKETINRNYNEDSAFNDITFLSSILFIILSIQSGLTSLEPMYRVQKLFKNTILLFISILHYFHKIVDEKLARLSVTLFGVTGVNKDSNKLSNNLRALSVLLYLFTTPVILLIYFWFKCEVSTWFLAASCFNLELISKTLITFFVYILTIIDCKRISNGGTNQRHLDLYVDIIKSLGSIIEFVFAILLLINSCYILIYESYSSIRAIMMVLHAYFHIWVQAIKGFITIRKKYNATHKLNKLRIYSTDIKNGKKESDDIMCTICLSSVSDGGEARITACNHYFHSACIITWICVENRCPLCHRPI